MKSKISIYIIGAVVAALCICYFFVDPLEAPWMPKCPVKSFTGLDCPGCGSQRLIHALLHGDFIFAFNANAFLFLLIPYLLLLLIADLFPLKFPRLFKTLNSTTAILIVSIAIVLWSIIRNIPGVFPAM